MNDIVIIGGGASGLIAAISAYEAARSCTHSLPKILILESTDKNGRSILRSGNGRCNFSNETITSDVYRNSSFVEQALLELEHAFPKGDAPNAVVNFFERHGLVWRQESEGRLYPLSNKASTVLDILRNFIDEYDIEVRCESLVSEVDCEQSDHFTLRLDDGEFIRARSVIICSGGTSNAYGLDRILEFLPLTPTLGSIALGKGYTKPLDNIRVRAALSLVRAEEVVAHERGEVMFRKYGISGIAAFNLSRFARPGDYISIDFFPKDIGCDPKDFLCARARELKAIYGRSITFVELLTGFMLSRITDQVLKYAGLKESSQVNDAALSQLAKVLKDFRLPYEGIGDASLCQVMRGGFAIDSFDPKTMEAKSKANLYIVGEALDVDGPCGGFNLHWAFASGMLAGRACVRGLSERLSKA